MNETQLIGKQVSHYRVIERLGEGGMGVVYRAEDTRLRRTVALKVVTKSLADDVHYQKRFLREAQTASAINHPNICTVYDILEEGDNAIIVMEFVDGVTLRKWMQAQGKTLRGIPAVDESNVTNIILQVADGLDAAHQKGIIHRDIKPENIMLSSQQRVKIMDFGLAKLRTDSTLTGAGTTVGTLRYMAPEQIRGAEADQRSDIYAVGIVLYETLSGEIPWQADHNAALMYAKTNYPPVPLVDNRPGTQPELSRIVMKCIATEPPARYQSLGELQTDLRDYESSSATRHAPVGPFTRLAARPRFPNRLLKPAWNRMSIRMRWVLTVSALSAVLLLWMIVRDVAPFSAARLSIVTQPPGAEIEVNREHAGQAPLEKYRVPSGAVNVAAVKAGYLSKDTIVTLATGELATLNLVLEPQPGGGNAARAGAPDVFTQNVGTRAPESLSQLASVVVDDLSRQAGDLRGDVLVVPLTYEDTKASSAFAQYFQILLETRLARVSGWRVVAQPRSVDPGTQDVAQAFSRASGAHYRVRGSYWLRSNIAQFFVSLEEIPSGRILGSSEANIRANLLGRTGQSARPGNLDKVLQDERTIAKGEISTGPLHLDLWTSHGAEDVVFAEGDTIAVYLRVNQPSYVRVIYNGIDGNRYLITGDGDLYVGPEDVNRSMRIKDVGTCSPPFGVEMIQAFARSEKFDPVKVLHGEGDFPRLANSLSDALVRTRGIKPLQQSNVSQVERRFVITTIPQLPAEAVSGK